MKENISTHITYEEATRTNTGLKNIPNDIQLGKMKLIADKVFEPLRNHFNKPIGISSFFRSKEVNYKIGGVKTSQHLLGEAIDIISINDLTNIEMGLWVFNNLKYDQLIFENIKDEDCGWIHISYTSTGNRQQTLVMIKSKNKSMYFPYKSLNVKDYA